MKFLKFFEKWLEVSKKIRFWAIYADFFSKLHKSGQDKIWFSGFLRFFNKFAKVFVK